MVAASSANISGQPPPRCASEAKAQLDGLVGLILDDGLPAEGSPSTIVDLTAHPGEAVVLRGGTIAPSDLRQYVPVIG